MHELAHIDMQHVVTGDSYADDTIEREADRWAAARLVSDSALAYAQTRARDDRELCEILEVDEHTLTARLGMARHKLPYQWVQRAKVS